MACHACDMAGAVQSEEALAAKFAALLPHLDERQRRLVMGAEARALGHGGIKTVARAAGTSAVTVSRGVDELEAGGKPLGRTRKPGGGRKPATQTDPGLGAALLALVEPGSRGDPESPLRWTTKSLRRPGSGAGRRRAPGVGAHGGQAAQGRGVQSAGQRQDHRGRPASRSRRPVPLPQRPGPRPHRHRRPGDQRRHQKEGAGRTVQKWWAGMASARRAGAGQRTRFHGQAAGQGDPVRRLRCGRRRRMGQRGHRSRHRRIRGRHHRDLVAQGRIIGLPARVPAADHRRRRWLQRLPHPAVEDRAGRSSPNRPG